MAETAKERFWREWAIDGMPKDKQRLAEAAWADATEAVRMNQAAGGGVVGYVCPRQFAEMRKDGGAIPFGTRSEAYGRTMPIYAAPPAAQVQQEAVAWNVLRIGNEGATYDSPNTRRAFTYDHQPGNVVAWSLGRATNSAANASAGDYIDRGLALLKALREVGFGVFQIGPDATHPAADSLGAVRELPAKTLLVSACRAGRHSFTADAIEDGGEPAIPFEVAVSALDAALAQAPAVRVTDEMVERACIARYTEEKWNNYEVSVRKQAMEWMRAYIKAALGQGKES